MILRPLQHILYSIAQVYHQLKGQKNPHFKRGSTVGFNKGMHADLDQKDLWLAAWGRWFKSQDFCSNRGGNTTAVNFRDYYVSHEIRILSF